MSTETKEPKMDQGKATKFIKVRYFIHCGDSQCAFETVLAMDAQSPGCYEPLERFLKSKAASIIKIYKCMMVGDPEEEDDYGHQKIEADKAVITGAKVTLYESAFTVVLDKDWKITDDCILHITPHVQGTAFTCCKESECRVIPF
jgi:hypothetical protein